MENKNGFTKYDVDGLDVYIYDGLELTGDVEIKYMYSIPVIGTVLSIRGLSSRGIRIKD